MRMEDLDNEELISQFRQITDDGRQFSYWGSIYDNLMYCCKYCGSLCFLENGRLRIGCFLFYYSRSYTGFFLFMLKVLFPVAIFSNLVVLQSKMIYNQTVGASTSAHERETEKKTKKDKNNHKDEILFRIADLEKATESVESLKEKVR